MSNFRCDKCKVDIIEGPDGHYVTGCEHYPIEPRGQRRFATIRDLIELEVRIGIDQANAYFKETGIDAKAFYPSGVEVKQ